LQDALEQGAAGIQAGTAFAFSRESGLREDVKGTVIEQALAGSAAVFTDPRVSPTGFPFKVVQLEGTWSDAAVYKARQTVCDLGYLREPYTMPDGRIGYRCAAEPVASYVAKGGDAADTVGRKCLCNALLANIGHPQLRDNGAVELPLVTAGDDLNVVAQFVDPAVRSYSAADVVSALLQS
jgi:nitronate monooxygenase